LGWTGEPPLLLSMEPAVAKLALLRTPQWIAAAFRPTPGGTLSGRSWFLASGAEDYLLARRFRRISCYRRVL